MSTVFNGRGIVVLAVKEQEEQANQTRAESINLSIRNLLLAEITDDVLSVAPIVK